jgi:hypothetical protein
MTKCGTVVAKPVMVMYNQKSKNKENPMNKKQAATEVDNLITVLTNYGVITTEVGEMLLEDIELIINEITTLDAAPVWKNHPSAQNKTKKTDAENVTDLWDALKAHKDDDEDFH